MAKEKETNNVFKESFKENGASLTFEGEYAALGCHAESVDDLGKLLGWLCENFSAIEEVLKPKIKIETEKQKGEDSK